MTGPARVVLVDDHDGYRRALAQVLEASGALEVVHQTTSAEDALDWVDAAAGAGGEPGADVVVCDLHLAGMDGIELCRRMATRPAAPPVCIVTADARHAAAMEALGAGAVGFIHKSTDPDEVVRLVRAAIAGEPAFDRATAGQLAVSRRGAVAAVPLSSRQLVLLRGLADGQSNDALCERTGLDPDAVRRLRERTVAQVGAANETAAVAWALRNGVIT